MTHSQVANSPLKRGFRNISPAKLICHDKERIPTPFYFVSNNI